MFDSQSEEAQGYQDGLPPPPAKEGQINPIRPPVVTESLEQQLEQRRQKIKDTLAVVSANMVDTDGYRDGKTRLNNIFIWQNLQRSLAQLPNNLSIVDQLLLANARTSANQLLEEINTRRIKRGEAPAETVFDQKQITAELPSLVSTTESVDMVQLSTKFTETTADIPRVLPQEFDENDTIWGRVNILDHDDVIYGVPSAVTAFDELRQFITSQRQLYRDGRYAGRWERSILYFRDPTRGNNLPKKIASYSESVINSNGQYIEKVEAVFDINGRVFDVRNTHFTKGEPSGITQLHFDYDSAGHISEVTQKELDASGKLLGEEKKPYSSIPVPPLPRESIPGNPTTTIESSRQIADINPDLPEPPQTSKKGAPGIVEKVTRFLGLK